MSHRAGTRRFWFGVVLLLGGAAHTAGVTRFYLTSGVPDANRLLLDVWIAEAQLVAGALFVKAARSAEPRPWAIGASIVVWSWALPFLPVLLRRAPPIFWVPPIVYTLASLTRCGRRLLALPARGVAAQLRLNVFSTSSASPTCLVGFICESKMCRTTPPGSIT